MGNILGSEKREVPIEKIFREACVQGRVEDVKSIIISRLRAGEDITAMMSELGINSDGQSSTPLMEAAWYEHSAVVKVLLEYNASMYNKYGSNALHHAAWVNEKRTTTVQLLLNNMKLEDINHKNDNGDTPLDMCYKYNDSSIKKKLIKLIRKKGGKRGNELEEAGGKGKGYKWWGGVNSRYNAQELKF
ncbi:MAG: hypothetical protein CMF41_01140 [Legionellales bacterium]|nr:hypothetical protein [Legionellales bacterium]